MDMMDYVPITFISEKWESDLMKKYKITWIATTKDMKEIAYHAVAENTFGTFESALDFGPLAWTDTHLRDRCFHWKIEEIEEK